LESNGAVKPNILNTASFVLAAVVIHVRRKERLVVGFNKTVMGEEK
jgi:hypothetical protein